ncbi:YgfY COG2938 [invertebrate metagenome]|uniref:YgfY COG2938 n=1 Tax=invertebrate metagenome TaxID=1711999 RepID=A0A484H5D6_9ZZZZ
MRETRENLLRRLYYQAARRGTKEADLLLEAFARIYLPQFDSNQLAELDRLLQLQDHDILQWRLGHAPLPPKYDGPVMRLLLSFDLVNTFSKGIL